MTKNTLKNTQNGFISIIAILAIILIIGGIAWIAYSARHNGITDGMATTTIGTTATTTTVVKVIPPHEVTVYKQVATYPGGVTFHSPFGLTLPFPATWAGYTLIQTNESYAGVPALATYNFNVGGDRVLTINAFTKEQWNNIRIQEEQDILEGETRNEYFGEGHYLGENTTYIFSYDIQGRDAETQTVVNGAVFY